MDLCQINRFYANGYHLLGFSKDDQLVINKLEKKGFLYVSLDGYVNMKQDKQCKCHKCR